MKIEEGELLPRGKSSPRFFISKKEWSILGMAKIDPESRILILKCTSAIAKTSQLQKKHTNKVLRNRMN